MSHIAIVMLLASAGGRPRGWPAYLSKLPLPISIPGIVRSHFFRRQDSIQLREFYLRPRAESVEVCVLVGGLGQFEYVDVSV